MIVRLLGLAWLFSLAGLFFSSNPPPAAASALDRPVRAERALAPGQVPLPAPDIPAVPSDTPTYEDEVMMRVNEARWDNGALPPLKRAGLLDHSSELHSENMAARDFFAHCDPDTGTLPWDRMEDAGYSWNSAGENIAAGYSTPAAVMAGWMGSSGHRANILSTGYRELGIGYFYQNGDQGNVRLDQDGNCTPDSFNHGPYASYWTQNFGRQNAVYPVVINREDFETATSQVMLFIYGGGAMTEMRFRNETGAWTAWEPFQADRSWTLSPGSGLKTIEAELRDGGGTVYPASDTIWLDDQGGPTPSPFPTPTLTPPASPTASASPTPVSNPTSSPQPSPTPSQAATPFPWTYRLYLPAVLR